MPVKIELTSQKFFSKLKNGFNFSANTGDFTSYLIGSVMNEVKVIQTVDVYAYSELRNYTISGGDTLVCESANFIQDGFSVGDQIKLFPIGSGYTGTTGTSISFVSETKIIISTTDWSGINGDYDGTDRLYNEEKPTGLIYKFGFVENQSPFSNDSYLDGSSQSYYFTNIPTTPSTETGKALGQIQNWNSGDITASFVNSGSDDKGATNVVFSYTITQTFVIPFFKQGELSNVQNVIPPEILEGDNSMKFVMGYEFRSDYSNPNSSKTGFHDTTLGAVSYLNENYNGFNNPFTVTSVTLEDENSDEIQNIDADQECTYTIVVTDDDSNFDANTTIVLHHAKLTPADQYTDSKEQFKDLFAYSNKVSTGANNTTADNAISELSYTVDSTSQITITAKIEFSSGYKEQIENGENYLVAVEVGTRNNTLTNSTSDRVTLLVDQGQYYRNTDIPDLWEVTKFELKHFGQEIGDTGYSNYKGFNEETVFLDAIGELSNTAQIGRIRVDLAAYNTVTESFFVLRNYTFDLSDQVIVDGVQQIEINDNREYSLQDDDIFHKVFISTGTESGGVIPYTIQLGFAIPWQEWLELEEADTVFYDNTEPQNGLNQKASNYSGVNDYEIRVLLRADILKDGITTDYTASSETVEIYDYDTDDQDPDAYTCEIITLDENLADTNQQILENKETIVRAIFTPSTPPTFTQSVDFTTVASSWERFMHGYLPGRFTGEWTDQQADDNDEALDASDDPYGKNDASLYTSTTSSILADQNLWPFYGLVSPGLYEKYSISGKMYSDNDEDNDVISFVLAYHVDEDGYENTLTLCVTTGGLLLDLNPSYSPGQSPVVVANNPPQAALLYNYSKGTCVQLDLFECTAAGTGITWGDAVVEDCNFSVDRSFDDFTVEIDWTIDSVQYTNTFTYNLFDNSETEKFSGEKPIGFAFSSQDQGGLKDVFLVLPEGDFIAELRLDNLDALGDKDIERLNTVRDHKTGQALISIDGSNRASLSYDGEKFFLEGKIDPANLQGKRVISADLRAKNLDE